MQYTIKAGLLQSCADYKHPRDAFRSGCWIISARAIAGGDLRQCSGRFVERSLVTDCLCECCGLSKARTRCCKRRSILVNIANRDKRKDNRAGQLHLLRKHKGLLVARHCRRERALSRIDIANRHVRKRQRKPWAGFLA